MWRKLRKINRDCNGEKLVRIGGHQAWRSFLEGWSSSWSVAMLLSSRNVPLFPLFSLPETPLTSFINNSQHLQILIWGQCAKHVLYIYIYILILTILWGIVLIEQMTEVKQRGQVIFLRLHSKVTELKLEPSGYRVYALSHHIILSSHSLPPLHPKSQPWLSTAHQQLLSTLQCISISMYLFIFLKK